MKSILISIKPRFVAKILNGEKTIEIRKTMPKCDLPIEVYIYCTKDKPYLAHATELFTGKYGCISNDEISYEEHNINGKVVAKFTLNKVEEIACNCLDNGVGLDAYYMTEDLGFDEKLEKQSCLTNSELRMYLGVGKNIQSDIVGYAWHISNLVIFDRPKELGEFVKCDDKHIRIGNCFIGFGGIPRLTKAPQSWQFIEVGDK